jgi:peptidoglycan/LPS O-acetylase OafA/YrhL
MNKAVPLLLLLILVSAALLLLIFSAITTSKTPPPFLIAAAITASVALCGAVFSLYTEKRSKSRTQQEAVFFTGQKLFFALFEATQFLKCLV